MADDEIFDEAGEHFRFVAGFTFEDAEQRRLRYHLLRLTVVGLGHDDVAELGELGRLAFQGSDVTAQVAKVKARAGASPLARAIAGIVGRATEFPGPGGAKAVMFGAVLGAYAGLSDVKGLDRSVVAVLGAIGGAAASTTSAFVASEVDRLAWADYLQMES